MSDKKMFKPAAPTKPEPPSLARKERIEVEYFDTVGDVLDAVTTRYNTITGKCVTKEELLASGFFNKIDLSVKSEFSDPYEYSTVNTVVCSWEEEVINASYDKQLASYLKKMEKYDKDLKSYHLKMLEYEEWRKEHNNKKEKELFEKLKKKYEENSV